jgi:hypothetical protein
MPYEKGERLVTAQQLAKLAGDCIAASVTLITPEVGTAMALLSVRQISDKAKAILDKAILEAGD